MLKDCLDTPLLLHLTDEYHDDEKMLEDCLSMHGQRLGIEDASKQGCVGAFVLL